jgi:thiamine-phosphate pyrophosphorylase
MKPVSRPAFAFMQSDQQMNNRMPFFQTTRREVYCFADTLPLCDALLSAGAKVIQLRHKKLDDAAFLRLAAEMADRVRRYPWALLIVNDRVSAALAVRADGIHIGQEDADCRDVLRRVPPAMMVGVSVDTVDQALAAEAAGAHYLGAGAVFATPTKKDARVIGLDGLRAITAAVRIPVVAIGGIALHNIRDVAAAGAHYFAIISQINQAADLAGRLAAFNDRLERPEGGAR